MNTKKIEITRHEYFAFRQEYRVGKFGHLSLGHAFFKTFGRAFCDRKDLCADLKNCKDDAAAQQLVGEKFRMV